MKLTLSAVTLLLLLAPAGPAFGQAPKLLVSGYTSGAIHAFDAAGASLGELGAVPGAQSMRYGPDGHLYVCAEESDAVLRFHGVTGAPLGPFVWDDPLTPADETGGLDTPTAAVFGPDGMLYVASFSQDAVLRYDGDTGAYIDEFISADSGTLDGPDAGMDFGPDGHLYIPSFNNNRVLRYDGKTGDPMGTFTPVDASVLSRPRCLRWRGDGLLYVTSWGNNRVLRYDLEGELVDIFATVFRPSGLAFDPEGNLLVTSDQNNFVRMFDGTSGAAMGQFGDAPGAGVLGATYLEWLPNPELVMQQPWPREADELNTFGLSNATPNGVVWLAIGVNTSSWPIACAQDFLGVAAPLFKPVMADPDGVWQATVPIRIEALGTTLVVQAYDSAGACLSNLVIATFD
ncbi:MAG: hypothetical protein DHS20C15_32350 [Planctomycetota bacterium]|nr:MAG: hypothetical protein DHS20C15_32350 [Planctomycetota bacterium]